MKNSMPVFAFLYILLCCAPEKKTAIQGIWKVDSIATYYNGFTFTRKDIGDEPILEYLPDAGLKMSKGDETRMFSFDISEKDTLYHRTVDNELLEKFSIRELGADRLILRKDLAPVFKGANQERYEIRYLSRPRHD